MDSRKRRRGRPAERSLEALEVDKLNRSIWNRARRRVWPLRRIHNTWKFLKGISCFNNDSDFAAHLHVYLLSLEMARLERRVTIFFLVFLERNLNYCAIWFYNLPYTAFRLISAPTKLATPISRD